MSEKHGVKCSKCGVSLPPNDGDFDQNGDDIFCFYRKKDDKKVLEYFRVPQEEAGYYCRACFEQHGTRLQKNAANICCETNDIALPAPVINRFNTSGDDDTPSGYSGGGRTEVQHGHSGHGIAQEGYGGRVNAEAEGFSGRGNQGYSGRGEEEGYSAGLSKNADEDEYSVRDNYNN